MMRGKRALDGLDQDIRNHIERDTQDNIDRGMTPEEARRQARLKFGNVALAKEDARAVWIWRWLDEMRQDARYARWTLRRQPGFAVVAIGILAAGIGLAASLFAVFNAAALRPWAVRDPGRVVPFESIRLEPCVTSRLQGACLLSVGASSERLRFMVSECWTWLIPELCGGQLALE